MPGHSAPGSDELPSDAHQPTVANVREFLAVEGHQHRTARTVHLQRAHPADPHPLDGVGFQCQSQIRIRTGQEAAGIGRIPAVLHECRNAFRLSTGRADRHPHHSFQLHDSGMFLTHTHTHTFRVPIQ